MALLEHVWNLDILFGMEDHNNGNHFEGLCDEDSISFCNVNPFLNIAMMWIGNMTVYVYRVLETRTDKSRIAVFQRTRGTIALVKIREKNLSTGFIKKIVSIWMREIRSSFISRNWGFIFEQ